MQDDLSLDPVTM